MIKSMTGYGRAREVRNKRDITVEVRSVNNRYLDCTVKMPRMYSFAEDAVKQCVQKAISRGKVDVFITVDASAADVAKVTVNRELAAQYAAALAELSEVCGTESKVTPEQLSRFPDVLTVTKEDEEALKRFFDLTRIGVLVNDEKNAKLQVEKQEALEVLDAKLVGQVLRVSVRDVHENSVSVLLSNVKSEHHYRASILGCDMSEEDWGRMTKGLELTAKWAMG